MAQQHRSKVRSARFSWGTPDRSASRARIRRLAVLEPLEARSLLAAATQLVVATEPPPSVIINHGFGLVVDAEDGNGVLDSTYNGVVTLTILDNPGGATLHGAVSVTASGGVATFSSVSLDQVGSGYTLQVTGAPSSAGALTPATTTLFNVTPLPATQLVVTTPPGGVTVNNAFTVVVSAENGLGQVDPNFSGTVTVALGNHPAGATLGGTLTEPAVNGVATFPDLTLDQIAGGYTLQFTTPGLTGATTALFSVAPAPATTLVVTTEPPANVIAGNPFTVVAQAMNAQGQLDTSYNGPVTVAFASPGGNPNGATLGGTLVVNAVNGVASFPDLTINKGGTGYVLQLTSGSLTPATTTAISSTVEPATLLVVTTQPPHSVAQNAAFGLVVSAESPQGHVDPTFTGAVTLVLLNPGTQTLNGTLTAPLVNGMATFTGLSFSQIGANFRIQASADGLTSATTSTINVTPAPATHLVVTVQPPSSIGVDSIFGLTVSAENALGLVDPNFSGVVTLAINPSSAFLNGLLSVTANAGVATFSGLTIDQIGSGYTIQATAGGVTAATTNPFNVTDTASPPSAPQLAPQSDTGISNTDGITRNNGSTTAPLTFIVNGVVPGNGYVQLYDVTNPANPIVLGGLTQATNGTAMVTISGTIPFADGTYQIAATATANLVSTPSALGPATSITITTSLHVVSFSPSGDFFTSLPNNQIVVTFDHWLVGLTPDVADGGGVASNPFAVVLIPSGPDGGPRSAASLPLWSAPSGFDSGDVALPAKLVYHQNANGTSTITLTPNQPLATDVYLVSVDGVGDVAGNPLTDLGGNPSPVYDSFTLRPTPVDASALAILSVTANRGATVINNNQIPQPDTIAIHFNKPVSTWTVNSDNVQLLAQTGPGAFAPVPSAVVYSPSTRSAYLTPEGILTPGVVYAITVSASVTDDQAFPALGGGLGTGFATSFTVSGPGVSGQVSPLVVTATSPADGTPWTGPFGYAAVTFSERVSLGSLGRYSAMLIPHTGGVTTGGSGYADVPVNAKLAFNPNTDQLILVPTGLLADNTIYLLALSGISASNGDPLTIPGGGTTFYSSFLLHPSGASSSAIRASAQAAETVVSLAPSAGGTSVTTTTAVVPSPAVSAARSTRHASRPRLPVATAVPTTVPSGPLTLAARSSRRHK